MLVLELCPPLRLPALTFCIGERFPFHDRGNIREHRRPIGGQTGLHRLQERGVLRCVRPLEAPGKIAVNRESNLWRRLGARPYSVMHDIG